MHRVAANPADSPTSFDSGRLIARPPSLSRARRRDAPSRSRRDRERPWQGTVSRARADEHARRRQSL